jgi:hypothetical protein
MGVRIAPRDGNNFTQRAGDGSSHIERGEPFFGEFYTSDREIERRTEQLSASTADGHLSDGGVRSE